jgi:hypothetical protein
VIVTHGAHRSIIRSNLDDIHDAIQATREEPLHDWAAVAVWGHAGGEVSIHGEADLLQLKGYLHSGLWSVAHTEAGSAERLERLSFDRTHDVRSFDKGRMDVVRIGGTTIGRGIFEPGWRWSQSVKPLVGTPDCRLRHIGYVLSGRMMISMDGGESYEIIRGQAINISPGHDAWTLGSEECVVLEILTADRYAQPQS